METLEVEGRAGFSAGLHLFILSADVGGFLRYKARYLPGIKAQGSVSLPEIKISDSGTVEIAYTEDKWEDMLSGEKVEKLLSAYVGGKLEVLFFALKGGLEYYLDGSEPLAPDVLRDAGFEDVHLPLDIREVGRLEAEVGILGGFLPYVGAKAEFSLAEGECAEALSEALEELLGVGEMFGSALVPKRFSAGITWKLPVPGVTVEVGASAVLDVFSLLMKAPAIDLDELASDPSKAVNYMDFTAGLRFGLSF
jgi:hypothetical protein